MRRFFSNLRHNRYFRNMGWLFFGKVVNIALNFIVSIHVTRYLGPGQFGILNYATAFVLLFSIVSTLGMDSILLKALVENPEKKNKLMGTAFFLRLAGGLFMFILIIAGLAFAGMDKLTEILIMIIASGSIFNAFNVIDLNFQAVVKSRYVVFTQVAQIIISSAIKLSLIWMQAPLVWFAVVSLTDSIVLATGLIYVYSKNIDKIFLWRFDRPTASILLKSSWPLIFGLLAANVYTASDRIFIKEMLGNEAVGYYSAAANLSSVWVLITVTITQSVMPGIINARKISRRKYLDRMQFLYNLLVKISFFISVIITIFSKDIVIGLYGKEYSQSVYVLMIHIWSINFIYLSNGSWAWYIPENLQKLASFRLIVGAILSVILNVTLINYYGLTGAAYALLVSTAISGYFINIFSSGTIENFKMQTLALINIFNIKTYSEIARIRRDIQL